MNQAVFSAWISARLRLDDRRGANLVEYVFLILLIALVVIIGVKFLGTSVSTKFIDASRKVN